MASKFLGLIAAISLPSQAIASDAIWQGSCDRADAVLSQYDIHKLIDKRKYIGVRYSRLLTNQDMAEGLGEDAKLERWCDTVLYMDLVLDTRSDNAGENQSSSVGYFYTGNIVFLDQKEFDECSDHYKWIVSQDNFSEMIDSRRDKTKPSAKGYYVFYYQNSKNTDGTCSIDLFYSYEPSHFDTYLGLGGKARLFGSENIRENVENQSFILALSDGTIITVPEQSRP
jgi:hypothetical protein